MTNLLAHGHTLIAYMLSIFDLFRDAMSRNKTFENFCEVLIGFMMREEMMGITDFVRLQRDDDKQEMDNLYQRLQKFFRSEGVMLKKLRKIWIDMVLKSEYVLRFKGRLVIVFDGVKVPKAGRYCVGSMKMSQHSGSVSKAEHIMGHMTGVIGILLQSPDGKVFFCPLCCDIEDGVDQIRLWEDPDYVSSTHVEQMFAHALDIFNESEESMYMVCDRYFLSREGLEAMEDANAARADGCRIDIITKAKSNIVAFEFLCPAVIGEKMKAGRPPKRGAAFKPAARFTSHASYFKESTMELYDKEKKVRHYDFGALWGRGLYREMKFVLVEMDDVRSILVTTDFSLDAGEIIALYARRWKVEESALRAKHVIGSYSYHFWTKACPKVNIYRKKDAPDPLEAVTDKGEQKRIIRTLHATELFLQIGHMAQGILQLMSIKARELELTTTKWLRTYSSSTRSEQTMGYDLRVIINYISRARDGSPSVKNMLETFLTQTSPACSTKQIRV